MPKKSLPYYAPLYLLLTLGFACASISSPQGGPMDSLPPLVESTSPLPYATNFSGDRVTIEFNEYVKLVDQQKIFFTSPEPKEKPLLSIRGKGVVVKFQDSLLPNKTYRLDFGSSIVDNNEGNKLDNYTFTFATGSFVDSLIMVGQALDAFTRDTIVGAFVPFYDLSSDSTYLEHGLDSTLYNSKSEAIFRSDSSGYFIGDILRDKSYRIYSFLDNNGNQRYEPGTDLVAFKEGVYNPVDMHGFSFGYDSVKKVMVIDSLQVTFELFKEKLVKRQNLMGHTRPLRAKLELEFNAEYAVIDSLELEGIESEWIIRDSSAKGDTIILWVGAPTKEQFLALPDTIKGSMSYARQDSVMNFYSQSAKLSFVHREPKDQETIDKEAKEKRDKEREARAEETKEKRGRDREAREKRTKNKCKRDRKSGVDEVLVIDVDSTELQDLVADSTELQDLVADSTELQDIVADSTGLQDLVADSLAVGEEVEKEINPFGFKVEASQQLNPEHNIAMTFDYPLRRVDTTIIELKETVTEHVRGARKGSGEDTKEVHNDVPIRIERDGLRRIVIIAQWKAGGKYELLIPAGAFEDIIFNSNDTLESSFEVLDPDKFGTLIFNITADRDEIHAVQTVVTADTLAALSQEIIIGHYDDIERDTLVVERTTVEFDSTLVDEFTPAPKGGVDMLYIVELVSIEEGSNVMGPSSGGSGSVDQSSQRVVQRRTGVKVGDKLTFKFLDTSIYYLRVIEDRDGNGEWTTGNLRERIEPERSRIYMSDGARHRFETKENWEISETINVVKLFE